MRVLVCSAQVPFVHGGAEILVETLVEEIGRRGHEVDLVALPFAWSTREEIFRSAMAWRMLWLDRVYERPVDRVIATRFPSYLVRHPNKVVWLVHQFRQVYDLDGTRYSDFGDSPRDESVRSMIRAMDRRCLAEARGLFAISSNTAQRLKRWNGLDAEVLYPPPLLDASLRPGPFGDYVFTVSRLDEIKRVDLLLQTLARCRQPVRAVIAGDGPDRDKLATTARGLGLADRVEFLGRVDDARLPDLYSRCLGVFYAPFDEDYGYVTVEAFRSGKPVITFADAGGVLEFVEDGRTGCVAPAGNTALAAAALDRWFTDREEAGRLGDAGRRRVEAIAWSRVVERLLGPAADAADPGAAEGTAGE